MEIGEFLRENPVVANAGDNTCEQCAQDQDQRNIVAARLKKNPSAVQIECGGCARHLVCPGCLTIHRQIVLVDYGETYCSTCSTRLEKAIPQDKEQFNDVVRRVGSVPTAVKIFKTLHANNALRQHLKGSTMTLEAQFIEVINYMYPSPVFSKDEEKMRLKWEPLSKKVGIHEPFAVDNFKNWCGSSHFGHSIRPEWYKAHGTQEQHDAAMAKQKQLRDDGFAELEKRVDTSLYKVLKGNLGTEAAKRKWNSYPRGNAIPKGLYYIGKYARKEGEEREHWIQRAFSMEMFHENYIIFNPETVDPSTAEEVPPNLAEYLEQQRAEADSAAAAATAPDDSPAVSSKNKRTREDAAGEDEEEEEAEEEGDEEEEEEQEEADEENDEEDHSPSQRRRFEDEEDDVISSNASFCSEYSGDVVQEIDIPAIVETTDDVLLNKCVPGGTCRHIKLAVNAIFKQLHKDYEGEERLKRCYWHSTNELESEELNRRLLLVIKKMKTYPSTCLRGSMRELDAYRQHSIEFEFLVGSAWRQKLIQLGQKDLVPKGMFKAAKKPVGPKPK